MSRPSRAFPLRPVRALPPPAPVRQDPAWVLGHCLRCGKAVMKGQPHDYLGAALVCPACYSAALGLGGR